MKNNNKGKNMNNLKKIGLTALAGSLVGISANAAELSVSGASVLTYTKQDTTEVTGNPMGMKTNLSFTGSGEVNGYTVSYMQTSADQFAGMSSARLSMDMGDLGTIAFDQGSGSGLATIDDKTPSAAEEVWDGVGDGKGSGRVGAAGSSGVFNYVKSFQGITLNAAARTGAGGSAADGSTVGAGQSAWDFAISAGDDVTGVAGLSAGAGYGEAENSSAKLASDHDDEQATVYANYAWGPVNVGAQLSEITEGTTGGSNTSTIAWGIAFNVNDDLSVSYGERVVDYEKAGAKSVDETYTGVAVAYTMGSMKISGNQNDVENDGGGTSGDTDTEIAISFAF